jgi:hypothetical protein
MLSEADRKRYFAAFYPADLMATFLGGRRCATSQGPPGPGDTQPLVWQMDCDVTSSAPALAAYMRRSTGMYSVHANSAIAATVAGGSGECEAVLTAHEFALDVDLKDYGERRGLLCGCGANKTVCDVCWLLAEMAAAACEAIVSGVCKLGPMLCVASGGKGFHMWWGSPQARRLSRAKRQALMALLANDERSAAARTVREAAIAALMDVWVKRGIVKRALLADANSPLARALAEEAASVGGTPFAWAELNTRLLPGALSKRRWEALVARMGQEWARGLVALVGWPILDKDVTLQPAHLLKTAFSIHHTSRRIALPLPSIGHCLPSQLPTVSEIMDPGCKEAKKRWDLGRSTLQAWLVACQYGPQYDYYNV